MNMCIETDRLILRQFSVDDVENLHSICNQPHILRWMPDWKISLEERTKWIKWVEKEYLRTSQNSVRIMLAIILKSNKELIGMVGVGNKEEVNNEIEIAYFISNENLNKGYMGEAVKAMAEWVFNNLNLDYLIAIAEPDNIPSRRVLEKCDFTQLETKIVVNSGETEEKPFYYYRLFNTGQKHKKRTP